VFFDTFSLLEYHASSEGSCRRGARRAADRSSPRSPAPDGSPWEPGARAPGFAPFTSPRGIRDVAPRGVALAIPDTAGPRPVHLTALGVVARTAHDGLLIATALVAVVFSMIQWTTPGIIGVDGYYHIKISRLMLEQGWRILFPLQFSWLQLTVLNPNEFTDHHLLFHLLLAPFTLIDMRIGAKLAAVVFASSALLVMYQVMAENRVRAPLLWLIVAMASAGPFLYRLSMARRQSLTILLLLLAILVAFRGRTRWLLPIGFAFTWLFDGFPLLLGVCGAVFLGLWWERRRPEWGLLLYPALGVVLGNVVHPYFPDNILFSYLHMLPKLFQLVGWMHGDDEVRVGNEWYPYSQQFMLEVSWLAIALVPLGFVPILLDARPSRLRRMDGMVVALGIIAVTFLLLYLRSRRWIEAEPVFATLFCAFAWSRALPERVTEPLRARLTPGRLTVLAVVFAVALLPLLARSVDRAQDDARSARDYTRYRNASAWLAANTPPGSRVFATDWDDFPELFFWNVHNTYLLGLDPTYMYLYDGPLYLQWRAITRGQVDRPGAAIRDVYDSGWAFSDLDHEAFIRRAAADPDMVEVYRDRWTVIYAVRGWQPRT
jgi:hypothetical protein